MSGPSGPTKRKKIDAMQVTETLAEGLKHEFKISVPASDLDAKAGAKLVDLKDKVRLNGFRPGKVPVSHLKKVYGRSVMAETIDQTIRDTNTQIFTDRGFRLATEPKITMPTEQKEVEELLAGKTDLTYTVAIEVVPTIQLADFKSFAVEKPVVDVSDSDVDDAIKRIADQSRPYNAKSEGANAENGDRVTVNFKGTIDAVPFDGGTGEGIQVVIGAGQFIPGFEEQLIGIGAGETRTVKASFPKNYASEKLAGQPAEFETTATLIEAPGGSLDMDFGSWMEATFGAGISRVFMRPYNGKVCVTGPLARIVRSHWVMDRSLRREVGHPSSLIDLDPPRGWTARWPQTSALLSPPGEDSGPHPRVQGPRSSISRMERSWLGDRRWRHLAVLLAAQITPHHGLPPASSCAAEAPQPTTAVASFCRSRSCSSGGQIPGGRSSRRSTPRGSRGAGAGRSGGLQPLYGQPHGSVRLTNLRETLAGLKVTSAPTVPVAR
jgi:hypothetical protein